MNELADIKETPKGTAANAGTPSWLTETAKFAFGSVKEKPVESAAIVFAAATLGLGVTRLKLPVLEKLGATESVSLSKSGLKFEKIPDLPADRLAIPSFKIEGGPERAAMRTIPEFNIVSKESTDARVYSLGAYSTFRVYTGHNVIPSSGFLVDEKGLIATAHHVVSNAELPYFVGINGAKVPAKLVARDPVNDVALLQVDTSVKGIRPLDLHLDAFSKVAAAQKGAVKYWDDGIPLDRTAYLIGFPDNAKLRVMTKGPAETIGLIKGTYPKADYIGTESGELFAGAKIMHKVTSFGGNSGGPLMLENGLVAGVHVRGRYGVGAEYAEATSVHHLARLLDEVRLRPLVSGHGDYATPVFVVKSPDGVQIVRRINSALRKNVEVPATVAEVPAVVPAAAPVAEPVLSKVAEPVVAKIAEPVVAPVAPIAAPAKASAPGEVLPAVKISFPGEVLPPAKAASYTRVLPPVRATSTGEVISGAKAPGAGQSQRQERVTSSLELLPPVALTGKISS